MCWPATVWGFLLPLYAFMSIPPAAFDLARVAVLGVLALKVPASSTEADWSVARRWLTPGLALGLYIAVVGLWRAGQSDVVLGATTVVSVAGAGILSGRRQIFRRVLGGFALGGTLSGAAVILQSTLSINLGSPAAFGLDFWGLSSRSTRVSYELAISVLVLCLAGPGVRGHRLLWSMLRWSGAAVCLAGLLLCGGRGGAIGLGAGMAVLARLRYLRFWQVCTFGCAFSVLLMISGMTRSEFSTVSRFTTPGFGQTDDLAGFSNGRLGLFEDAWHDLFSHAGLGAGSADFERRFGTIPHFSPFAYTIAAGLLAGVLVTYMYGRLIVEACRRPGDTGREAALGSAILAVMAVWATLEPSGPFTGIALFTLLVIASILHNSGRPFRSRSYPAR
jgi:hypothetical protein